MSKPEICERKPSDPTPTQIRQRAAAIRRHWSKSIAERRRVWISPSWQPPLIMSVDWMLAITSEFIETPHREP
jgi:hypothetical protein